jgi:glutamate synthase (ferredoxin)
MRTPRRERDACGIGFVADASGTGGRSLVTAALEGLARVKHRGAVAADARTSDGTGLLTPIPRAIFGEGTGVVSLFVSGDDGVVRTAVEAAADVEGLTISEWRVPPTDESALGELAVRTRPQPLQAILAPLPDLDDQGRERSAYRLRRRIQQSDCDAYVVSCSYRTVVYKGLVAADAVADHWLDLGDERFGAPWAIFHQRFSTNTVPTWERAQPFRNLCHNGEINTLWGNINRLTGRGTLGTEAAGLGEESLFRPLVNPEDSDSGTLDEVVELLQRGGRSAWHSVHMLVPDAWEEARDMAPDLRGFYAYHSALMAPWDGPAGLVFTDGAGLGASLDRNGLRPLRYAICEDGFVACSSESGAIDVSGHGTVERGRLGPGQMLWVAVGEGDDADPTTAVWRNNEVQAHLGGMAPYARWAADGFEPVPQGDVVEEVPGDLVVRQAAFDYTKEELAMVIKPMAEEGKEPTFSMGDDTPLANLAGRPRPIHHYLKQRFAQVTNPPIDPLRERLVMSTRVLLGPRRSLLTEEAEAAQLLDAPSFLLFPSQVDALEDEVRNPYGCRRLDATFPVADGPDGLEARVRALADEAEAAVRDGSGVLLVDDGMFVGPDWAPVPALLAVGAVQQRLLVTGLRSATSIVAVSDDARDVHYVAALLGFGADALCPRLALQTVVEEIDSSESGELTAGEAQERFFAAIEAGVLKILSKMGISTVMSYTGGQLFEALGLGDEVVDLCFRGAPNVLRGVSWRHLGEDVLTRHAQGYDGEDDASLESPGFYRVRTGGETHGKDRETVAGLNELAIVPDKARKGPDEDPQVREMATAHLLQRAIAGEEYELYESFASMVDDRSPIEPHDLLELVTAPEPTPLDEVEPASEIVKRFSTGAMSHGALSKEAHETLAQAMNLIGAKSNCGEGGEDPARFRTRGMGRLDTNSRIKQVASGRFGVTPEYLAHADDIQIKVAQGSKPGEGGQLPAHKVSTEIARLRHTQPGIGLISPPPHHDIYSIEDLAQLIFDLKQVNSAHVSVKLVAEDGVGTIAAGVVKALSDTVHISGHNGGTGASPLSSIKHAGLPWELGLADTQQALVDDGLRSRARVVVDGGFMTGRQVITAALMGADEYSFGTSAMIAEGCIMLRACHRDTCKPGVATQRPNLRANFTGTPEGVAAYFLFVAEHVRRELSKLGARTLDEVIGRVELLRQRTTGDPRVDSLDLSPLLERPADPDAPRHFVVRTELQDPRSELGDLLRDRAFRGVWEGQDVQLDLPITNADRAVGAALSGAIALEFGEEKPPGTLTVRFTGTAGQSFGVFLAAGIELDLTGEANDYVGKGMGGGRIVVRPPADDVSLTRSQRAGAEPPVLAGNTCLYGATGGELFVAGMVGERFAVRNSGALAVVEAAGDHCCEYMTGGTIVVLGRIGANLGAGMTGGQAFVWDPEPERVLRRVNQDLIEVLHPDQEAIDELRWLVERHAELTGSPRSADLLVHWDTAIDQLWHVLPRQRADRQAASVATRVSAA